MIIFLFFFYLYCSVRNIGITYLPNLNNGSILIGFDSEPVSTISYLEFSHNWFYCLHL